jgi:hypothetical protein
MFVSQIRFSKPKGGETRPVADGLFTVMDKTICGIIVVAFFFACLFSNDVNDDFGGY